MAQSNTPTKETLNLKELIAMGVGGMVGGGIFSVLGLAVLQAGHAAPVAFALGGIIALITGVSYTKLGLHFHSDGGSFTYLEHAFAHRNIAGLGGWLLLTGYIGTMALYAYTFGVYGAAMIGQSFLTPVVNQHILASLILLVFLGINLRGVKSAGSSEDVIVAVKLLILATFAVVGLFSIKSDYLLPIFNRGSTQILMGAALIFVAYEGFELIPNAANEMENPRRDLGRAIIYSIIITTVVYILVSLVAVGNLLPADIAKYKEYALAVAAKPALGQAGFLLIGLGALLSTASAINATMFGSARLGMAMAQEEELPRVFSYRERTADIPWVSMVIITAFTIVFVNIADLTIISSFASSTFLLIFTAINLSALKIHQKIEIAIWLPLLGFLLTFISWGVLIGYLWQTDTKSLMGLAGAYFAIILTELLFSERRLILKYSKQSK